MRHPDSDDTSRPWSVWPLVVIALLTAQLFGCAHTSSTGAGEALSPVPTALIWGLQDTVNPPRIGNHIWYTYLDKRAVESSYWILPTAGHYLQWDEPEEMAGIVRTCLEAGIPAPEDENAFMRTLARNRTATSPVYMGRSIIENVYFPGAVAYSPDGYSF